jgi:hypothetical protein
MTSNAIARGVLGVAGMILCAAPAADVAVGATGTLSASALAPLGVFLLVLFAFYPRITGELRCGFFKLTIAPDRDTDAERIAASASTSPGAASHIQAARAEVPRDL